MNSKNTTPLLDIRHLSSGYGAIPVLKDISMHIHQGEIVSLIGANGAGKSTLLMTVFGQPQAKQGSILFNQQEISHIAVHEIAGLGLAQVPEGRRIFSQMTVEENLLMGTVACGESNLQQDKKRVYSLFPLLYERKKQLAGTLSGGEQQMLAIARALMSRPVLLLLDEPSLGLAPMIVKQIFSIIKDIAAAGATIFLVEQNANHALAVADRAYVLVNGEIKMSGSGRELLNNPEIQKTYLGG